MVADKIFDLSISSQLVYQSDIPIKGKTFVKVFIDRVGEGTWEVIDGNDYQLINDSLVFTERPTGSLLIMQVATTPSELQQTPTDISLLLTIKEEIKTLVASLGELVVVSESADKVIVVANSIDAVNTVALDISEVLTVSADINKVIVVADNITHVNNVDSIMAEVVNVSVNKVAVVAVSDNMASVISVKDNLGAINTVSDNIIPLSSIYTDIVPNLTEILQADTNAQIATTKAGEALASEQKAKKWADEVEDVEVEPYKYSARHWAEKAKDLVIGGVIDDTVTSLTKAYSSSKTQTLHDTQAQTIANLSTAQGEFIGTGSPVLVLTASEQTLAFTVTIPSSDNTVFEFNDVNNTCTFKKNASYNFRTVLEILLNTNATRTVTVIGRNLSDNSLVYSRDVTIDGVNGDIFQINSNQLLTVGRNGVPNAPITLYFTIKANDTGVTVRSLTSQFTSSSSYDLTSEASGITVVPFGSVQSTNVQSALMEIVNEMPSPSIVASYHIYNGQLALSNTITTSGFSTTLYTGNGTTQSITTGVDMDTQWGNDVSEKFGGLVWLKSRSIVKNNVLADTVRGANNILYSDVTSAQDTSAGTITAFNNNGFTVGVNGYPNTNLATYASWNFQTTHRVSGTTNHGKAFTCHYNPFTGFTIVKYEGSGLAGHEIPHYLGRKLGFVTTKTLTAVNQWNTQYRENYYLGLNTTDAETSATTVITSLNDTNSVLGVSAGVNASSISYVMYGWADSYFDEKNTLIGNYEIGVYQGTGASGNKVSTRGKPAWVMIKRLDNTSNWYIVDNLRNTFDATLYPNLSNAESAPNNIIDGASDGFVHVSSAADVNASGGQYLYMVVYDNDSGSGKSKYPRATDTSTLNLNAHVPFANGIDTTGNRVSIAYKNETITLSNALTQGKNYIALLSDGNYIAKTIKPSYGLSNPASGDFFNLDTQKWYSNLNVEITPRNYLDCIVYADQNGQPEYVEQIEKVQYFDAVRANDFRGKNACTAWVNFDGTTTPPTIRDSYNIASVVRVSAGSYDVYFKEAMDNKNYSSSLSGDASASNYANAFRVQDIFSTTKNVRVRCFTSLTTNTLQDNFLINLTIFGGKN